MEKTLYNEQVYAIEPKLNEPTDIGRETNPYHNLFIDGDIYSNGARTYTTVEETEIIKSQTMESLTAVNAHITNLTASKASVADLEATYATIGDLQASKANITDLEAVEADIVLLNASKANITDLSVVEADIERLNAETVKTDDLFATNASIKDLSVSKADITDLVASKIKVDLLEGNTAILQTILTNFISGTSGQFIHLTGSNTVIDNAIIKDAMIDTVSLNKLIAGDISTNKFRIVSTSGQLIISDNTIQIKDSNRTRVQIGKDVNNDYSMYVWDVNGNLMFDATGLKAGGIKDKIIRNDMISDTANISGEKLNIVSVINSINNDGSTTIKGSKVKLDETGQTLNVAFNKLTTTVSDISIGTRNLILDSDVTFAYTGELTKAKSKQLRLSPWILESPNMLKNKYIVVSFEARTTNLVYGSTNPFIGMEMTVRGEPVQWVGLGSTTVAIGTTTDFTAYHVVCKLANTDVTTLSLVGIARDFIGTVEIKNWSITIGNKYVGWTPAPEDAFNSINNVANSAQTGGRNLIISKAVKTGHFLNGFNAENVNSNYNYTDYIPVEANQEYIASGYSNLGGSPATCFYDKDKVFISGIENGNITEGNIVTEETMAKDKRRLVKTPEGCFYLRFSFSTVDLPKIKLERGNKATEWSIAPEEVSSKIEANTTSLNVALGKIDTLVKNTTITKDGVTTQLKDAYTSTEQTVNSISSEVESLTTTVGDLGTTVESHSTKITQNEEGIALAVKSTEIDERIKEVYASEMVISKESIKSELSEVYISKDEEGNIIEKAKKASIDHTAEGFDLEFTNMTKLIKDVDDKIDDEVIERKSHIRLVDGKIHLGLEESDLKAVLDNDSLDFMQGDVIVSQITNQEMLITDAIIKNKLTLGNTDRGYFDFVPRLNGNLSLKWRSN